MNFLNPIEILELNERDFSSLDNATIKKAKRKLLTDIELSDDGFYQYKNLQYTPSDCESVIDELEDINKKEFYYFLANNKFLNNYLINGDEALFSSFQQESIFKLNEFQVFIAPYFVPRFDKSILIAFKNNDYPKLTSILRAQILLKESQINDAFKSVSFEINTRINSIQEVTDKIKNKQTEFTKNNIQSSLQIVKGLFPIKILNSLPSRNFQSLKNKVATCINYFQLAIDNEFGDTKLALDLLDYILDLEISSVSLPTFQQNREILYKRYSIQVEREQNAPVLKKWASTSSEINRIKTSIENKVIRPANVIEQLDLIIDVVGLNNLPSYADEIRDDVALLHRALSVISITYTILTRNSLKSIDLEFTLMVGGSTFIPYVRQRVEEILQIPANCEIDPTTAVAIGAAYYAATKTKVLPGQEETKKQASISIKPAYQKASKEKEEIFAARVTGQVNGLYYRITREDRGFDTGLKKLTERISEDLPLVDNAYNFFKLTVYDGENNVIETNMEMIGINSGFAISGQPLPDDICLEVDDYDNPGTTRLQLVFQKNTILPTKRTITYSLNKTIIKGSIDNVIYVNVLEGSHLALPEANKSLGYLHINGKQLIRDVAKGSDIEITVSISESRDITIAAYLNMADQEFKETFNPKERHTPIDLLKLQVIDLAVKLEEEIDSATEKEDYEAAGLLNKLKGEMEIIYIETETLTIDDVTDNRYKLEDRKRKIAQEMDSATKNKRIQKITEAYFNIKKECEQVISENGNDYERKTFNDIVEQESSFLATNSPIKIQEKFDEIQSIIRQIKWRTPIFLIDIFNWLHSEQTKLNDQIQAKSLLDAGKFALESKNWDRLKEINYGLLDLLPRGSKADFNTKIGFGL